MNSNELFFELSKQYETKKAELDKIREELNLAMQAIGIGTYLQDEDGTVFKIDQPTGTYVEFRKINYVRTARDGEKRGTLSKSEAQEAGFNISKKE